MDPRTPPRPRLEDAPAQYGRGWGGEREGERGHRAGGGAWGRGSVVGRGGRAGASEDLLAPKSRGRMNNK